MSKQHDNPDVAYCRYCKHTICRQEAGWSHPMLSRDSLRYDEECRDVMGGRMGAKATPLIEAVA
jgi:hypothetical protein